MPMAVAVAWQWHGWQPNVNLSFDDDGNVSLLSILPPFLLSSVHSHLRSPPEREPPTGRGRALGCKGHPWGNCTEVAREAATYESWESGDASER